MINSVRLKDFQAHKDSRLDFVDGINVITASSGVGKSSIIRAISYLFTNKKPANVKYERRPDCKGFEIEVNVDGHIIKRVKSTKANEYHIDGEVYKDIGVNVPDKVYSLTNIKPITVGTEEFNIQLSKQFDPHFLMFLSDSSKVKFLNRLSGSHILDIALKETNKDLLQIDRDKLNNENELTQVQTSINSYVDIIDPIKNAVSDAKMQYEQLSKDVERLSQLKALKVNLDRFNDQKREFDAMQLILSKVNIEGFDFKINKIKELRNLYNQYISCSTSLKKIEEVLNQISGIDTNDLENKIKRLDKLDSFNVKYNELKIEMDSLESQLVSNNRQINDNITRVKSFLESNPKCPTCNTTITKNKIDKIIKELEG